MKNKTGFYETISGYLKKGVLSPIFSSDTLAVLRVADSFYIASDYTQGKHGYITFLVNSKMIRAMMLDNGFLEQLVASSDRETLATMMFELDKYTFQRFRKASKGNPLTDLHHNFVDPQMEQWIFDIFGVPDVTVPASDRRGLLNLFK